MFFNGKHPLTLALALTLALGLTACGGQGGSADTQGFTTYDAEIYVDGLIKENYLGEADEKYMDLVGITKSSVETLYDNALHLDVEYFLYMYDIDYPTDELKEEIEKLYKEIYQHIKYHVVSAAEQEDGTFAVKVSVSPIDIAQTVNERMNKAVEEFYEKYPREEVNAMGDEEYEKMDNEWAEMILNLYQESLGEIGNMSEETITLQVEPNSEGLYTVKNEDFARLDALIVDYSNVETDK